MSQQVSWYKKYRPKTFEAYSGDFIDSAVKRISNTERRPQVFLVHGVHGCGKTTASRLFAGFYLCTSLTDEGKPCGKCDGCRQLTSLIENGEDDATSESIQEINGSLVNKVEDIRKLINDSMLTLPTFSKYKVFIIDECHRITPEAQNALLKVLEDVPPYLVVIFATTEHEKLLPTIISRCQLIVEVRKQTLNGMTAILETIAQKESLTYERRALQLIAKKGGRIPRDCISLLEDIAMTYDNCVTSANVLARIGEIDTKVYFRFMEAAHTKLVNVLTFVSELAQGDISYREFLSGLSRFVLESIYVRMGISIEDYDKDYLKVVNKLFKRYKVDEYHVLLKLIDEASRRNISEMATADIALTVLAIKIGEITKVQKAVHSEVVKNDVEADGVANLTNHGGIANVGKDIHGDSVKTNAETENSAGVRKFVQRESENLVQAPQKNDMSLDEFMSQLGAVEYS